MPTVEIPDDLFEALRVDAQVRLRSDDPSGLILRLLHDHLKKVCAPGYDRDRLTGGNSRQSLEKRIRLATFGSSWRDHSVYRERFLCIDLDNFKSYLDVHGLMDGDVVLRDLARELQAHFGPDDVYRFGGDEFVVVLGDRQPWLPDAPPDVTFAHALVHVALHRNQHRNHHIDRWIDLHLDAGILASTPEGTRIDCGDPIWLGRGHTPA